MVLCTCAPCASTLRTELRKKTFTALLVICLSSVMFGHRPSEALLLVRIFYLGNSRLFKLNLNVSFPLDVIDDCKMPSIRTDCRHVLTPRAKQSRACAKKCESPEESRQDDGDVCRSYTGHDLPCLIINGMTGHKQRQCQY